MKVLILGSGAREHAMAEAVAASPLQPQVFVAPGNDGLRSVAECVALSLDDVEGIADWAASQAIDMTIAGSEEPLVRGVWDAFDARHLKLFGPSAAAAQLEGSKVFAKEFMRRQAIPTADFTVCNDLQQAQAHVQDRPLPMVIKADGLAAGKGVFVAQTAAECDSALEAIFVAERFGAAGRQVLIEDCLQGVEVSVFAICDGYSHRILGVAQDHKRAYDGDAGPNTGGMGAYSPVGFLQESALRQIEQSVLAPTLVGMVDEGMPYRGFLYLGLMMTAQGPQLLEYNCRLGDPEAQVLLPRIDSDFLELVVAAESGEVTAVPFHVKSASTVGVVVASQGYPQAVQSGRPVSGVDAARQLGARVYCAGVKEQAGSWVSSGGRILTVVAEGDNHAAALQKVYEAVDCIEIPGSFHRRDIGAHHQKGEACKSQSSAS